MNQIIVTSESQLSDLIARAINIEFRRLLELTRPTQFDQPPLPEILNVKQAAGVLDLAPSTIYGLVHRSCLPHSKKGGKLRFKRSQLLEWIDSGDKKTLSKIQQEVEIYTRKPSNTNS